MVAIELDDLARRADARLHQRASAGEQIHLAVELPGLVADDERVAARIRSRDLDATREHDEERRCTIACMNQELACRRRTHAAVSSDSRNLRLRQPRVGSIAVLCHRMSVGIAAEMAIIRWYRAQRPIPSCN